MHIYEEHQLIFCLLAGVLFGAQSKKISSRSSDSVPGNDKALALCRILEFIQKHLRN